MRPRSKWRWVTLIAILAVVAAACGSTGDEDPEGGEQGATIIRFSFAPDPVWDWMNDTAMVAEWEEANNIRMATSATWDEFTYFAGGHGDIVSMATMELPVLEQETGIKTVSFGKYNAQRSPMMTRADSGYETLEDVPPGSTICVSSPVSNTGFWTVAMNELHGIDYRVGGGDYELVVNDHFVNPENLLNGDCEAAVIIPEAAAPYLRTGDLVLMYDGLMPFQLYNSFSPVESDEMHIMSNLFTATEEFYDAHPDEVAAFLALWESGIAEWNENQADIIALYPQHFAVEAEEDIAYIQEFMAGPNDWFVDSVYMTEDWVESEIAVWPLMTELHEDNQNRIEPGFEEPRFDVIEAP